MSRLLHRTRKSQYRRQPRRYEIATLPAIGPHPGGNQHGRVLLSLLNDPFYIDDDDPSFRKHTNVWETREIATAWRERGYIVDVISWQNNKFMPETSYDVCIDARLNLARLDRHLNGDCIRVMHCDTAHWLTHTTNQHVRLASLKERRSVALPIVKTVDPNSAIEHADCATILGPSWAMETYKFARTPMIRVPLSTQTLYDNPDRDWEMARRRFLWIGSEGAVHKGLDLVLEAFAEAPELHLTVVGPVDKERQFSAEYAVELNLPNIDFRGFMDITSDSFKSLMTESGAVVFASCSESGAGTVVGGMHAGLIPVVTPESHVDSGDIATIIEEPTPQGVLKAIREVAEEDPIKLEDRSHRAWEFARANHTQEHFAANYRKAIDQILSHGKLQKTD